MKKISYLAIAAIAAAFTLTACSSPAGDKTVIAPVTMEASELQGTTVDLIVGQVLNIDTGSLAVDSYSGKVADPSIAKFVAGREDASATFNPGVEALAAGSTAVTLTNEQGGIQPLEFTVSVRPEK